MATLIEALNTYNLDDGREVFDLKPAGYSEIGNYTDGYVSAEWFKNVFPNVANAEIPLSQDEYQALKNIGDCWEINAINWRKDSTIEVEGIAADEQVEEEEAFLLEMYPPAPETETTPEEETEEIPEGEEIPAEETEQTPENEEAEEIPAETTPETEEQTEEA